MIEDSQVVFLDTSSLVKLYVLEEDSHVLVAHAANARELVVSAIAEFEFLSAIGRRSKDGELTAKQYEQLRSAFYSDWSETFVQQPLSDTVLAEARLLLSTYRLRTLDAFQLASAITYSTFNTEKPIFLTADLALREVAIREGFETSVAS